MRPLEEFAYRKTSGDKPRMWSRSFARAHRETGRPRATRTSELHTEKEHVMATKNNPGHYDCYEHAEPDTKRREQAHGTK
jgi:hypothetical protein